YCIHRETSDKSRFPTFARTRPPDTHISKSVASLLLAMGWRQVALLHAASGIARRLGPVAATVAATLASHGVRLRHLAAWRGTFHYGYGPSPFDQLVADSMNEARGKPLHFF
ncbi:unnamed protein product, partial [Ixodes hexagonus]